MKRVFLNADDFGRSRSRNKAIDECFKRGLIESAGLIVTGRYLDDAVQLIKAGGYENRVHCHFNLSGNIVGEDSVDVPFTKKIRNDKAFCKDGIFIPYSGLPNKPLTVFKFIKVYKELIAQFNCFIEVTGNRGNKEHIDFHLWYNLTWPVSIALNLFTWTHSIKSVRYIGVHQEKTRRRLFRLLSWNPFVKSFRSSNIDCFLSHPDWFDDDKSIELYCHPDYMDGILMDNSISYFGHRKRTMEDQIESLKKYELELSSWGEYKQSV